MCATLWLVRLNVCGLLLSYKCTTQYVVETLLYAPHMEKGHSSWRPPSHTCGWLHMWGSYPTSQILHWLRPSSVEKPCSSLGLGQKWIFLLTLRSLEAMKCFGGPKPFLKKLGRFFRIISIRKVVSDVGTFLLETIPYRKQKESITTCLFRTELVRILIFARFLLDAWLYPQN